MLNSKFAKLFSQVLVLVSFVQMGLASCGIFDVTHPYIDSIRLPTAVVQIAAMSWLTGWEFAEGSLKRGILKAILTVSLGAAFVYLGQNGWLIPAGSLW